MSELRLLEVPVAGMDCAECTEHVRRAIASLPGVTSVDVFLASEKARGTALRRRLCLPSRPRAAP